MKKTSVYVLYAENFFMYSQHEENFSLCTVCRKLYYAHCTASMKKTLVYVLYAENYTMYSQHEDNFSFCAACRKLRYVLYSENFNLFTVRGKLENYALHDRNFNSFTA